MELNKIYNEDCLQTMKRMPDGFVDCIVMSPPYNKGNKKVGKNQTWYAYDIAYDSYKDCLPNEEYLKWQKEVLRESMRVLKEGGSIFYNHKPIYKDGFVKLPLEIVADFPVKQVIIWDRGSSPDVNVNKFYPTTEWIIWIGKGKTKFNGANFSNYKEVWRINFDPNNEHPAPFPLEIPQRCILATTQEGDLVYDPFMGSGTTAVACKMLKRNYIGSEISAEYCKLAEDRIKSISNTLF